MAMVVIVIGPSDGIIDAKMMMGSMVMAIRKGAGWGWGWGLGIAVVMR